MAWITLPENMEMVKSSSFSTISSSRMLISTQRGRLPMVSPGRNVRDVLTVE